MEFLNTIGGFAIALLGAGLAAVLPGIGSAKGVNLSGTIKFAVVCRLLSSGPSSYTYTDIADWKVD